MLIPMYIFPVFINLQLENLVKNKLEGLREAWTEEKKERDEKASKQLETLAQVRFWCNNPFQSCRVHMNKFQDQATRQERLEKDLAELKENTLEEEEVVRLVEKKCAKLRFELLSNQYIVIDKQKPFSLLTNTNLPTREELEERMLGLEEEKRRGVGGEDWKEVRQASDLLLGCSYKIYLDNIKQIKSCFCPKDARAAGVRAEAWRG